VLIADSNRNVRWALRTAINEQPHMVIVGECLQADTLSNQVEMLHPDLLLLDWDLPGRSTSQLPALSTSRGRPWVIVLGVRPEAEKAALAAGADAFLSKADPPERLLAVLQQIPIQPISPISPP
jgi:DNA-binding NarL/FixJ family response regulator